jgi:tRNA (cmo5U34)-methyltransferase
MSEFDQKANGWDKNQMHMERTKAVAGKLLEMVPITPDMKALEFGAGTGLLSFYLKDRFSEITLMDSSREMLNMAEQKIEAGDHGRIKTLFINLETEEYQGGAYEIIFNQMVMHHIKDVKSILKKFYHILTPGGVLAIADLYPEDGSFHDGATDVHFGFDPGYLEDILHQQGFDQCKAEQCFIIPKELAPGKFKEYPVFLMTAIRK